ncbi:MAG: hypothetical protein WA840_04250 [Caulobacteraceae bacterium]
MSVTLPTPGSKAAPLLIARRAVREVRRTIHHYRNASKIELLSQFESLGDNCEFANFQKSAGVDQPGLFKWMDTSVPGLVATLANELAGVDDIANLELKAAHDGEYLLHHRLFGSASHTFARVASDDPGKVLQREHRRLIMLRRKFLEDVHAARRTYVFRSLRPVTQCEASSLLAALRRKGPNTLLWVRPALEPIHVGRVQRMNDGLLVADIDSLATYENGMTWTSQHWLPILDKARALAAPVPPDRLSGETAA